MKLDHPSTAVRHEVGTDLAAVTTRARDGADVFEVLDAANAAFLEENRREIERFTREVDEALGPMPDFADLQMSPPCAREGEE